MVHDFFATILGIRPANPGWTAIEITPQFTATTAAQGRMTSPTGPISVRWSRAQNGTVQLSLEAPPGIPVQIRLADWPITARCVSPREVPGIG
ncbi:MAG: hypothetical protein J6386_02425 [Candidatus Synoicihabitans palmerolidicus]|nr:hypothetical protein [Candidatus Synoicihabitans palmerolidicus]